MDFSLTSECQKTVDTAARVARECLEPRAAEYDAASASPMASWHDLHQHNFLASAIPAAYGGLGLDMMTYVMVIEQLAQGCVNTAMTLHMHSVVQLFIEAMGTPAQKSRWYPEVVEEGKLFGSWGSEPDRRGGAGVGGTVITAKDDGYVVNGYKHFCTMAGAAYRYLVHCAMAGLEASENYTLTLVPHDAPGLRITGEWNTLGMRATVSPSASFDDCVVSADAVLGKPGQALELGVGLAFGLGYAAVYLGAAQRALEFAIDYCQTHQFEPEPVPLAHSLVVQQHVAEMTMALEGARLILYQSAGRWAEADMVRKTVLAARAKYVATEAALMVTSKAIQTVGGRSVHRHFPLERLFRDVRTSTLMPPNADRAIEITGKAALGLTDEAILERGNH